MEFKRPKTENNFALEDLSIYLEVEDEAVRSEQDCDLNWNAAIGDPVNFWYLMQIFDIFKTTKHEDDSDNKNPVGILPLVDIWDVIGYDRAVARLDDIMWEEYLLYDFLPTKDRYVLIAYRLAWLANLFFAFDIHSLFTRAEPQDMAIGKIYEWLSSQKTLEDISDNDVEELYYMLSEVMEVRIAIQDRRTKKLEKEIRARTGWEGIVIGKLSEKSDFELFPCLETWKKWSEEVWMKMLTLWNFTLAKLEFDIDNMEKLKGLLDTTVSELFESERKIESTARSFTELAKKCQIIGNMVFIPFQIAVNAEFPCLQYLYWLQKQKGCLVISWKIREVFEVRLFDPAMCHILEIWGDSNSRNEIDNIEHVAYDKQKMVLTFHRKRLSLWQNNDRFIQEYFNLSADWELWVAIDDMIEILEPRFHELNAERKMRTKKSLIYDRTNLLSRKIATLTDVVGLFKIENGYIKITRKIRVE